MRRTEAKPGKPQVLKLKEDEEQAVIDWINEQSVYADSMRYLIQKEIAENGIRNLQLFIPRIRDIESIRQQLKQDAAIQAVTAPLMQNLENAQNTSRESSSSLMKMAVEETKTLKQEVLQNSTNLSPPSEVIPPSEDEERHKGAVLEQTVLEKEQGALKNNKRKAAKKFDSSVIGSYQ